MTINKFNIFQSERKIGLHWKKDNFKFSTNKFRKKYFSYEVSQIHLQLLKSSDSNKDCSTLTFEIKQLLVETCLKIVFFNRIPLKSLTEKFTSTQLHESHSESLNYNSQIECSTNKILQIRILKTRFIKTQMNLI